MKVRAEKIVLQFLLGILFLLNSAVVNAQHQFVVPTSRLVSADTSWLFIPHKANAFQQKKFPIIIMLHGYGGNYKQWNNIVDLQKYADKYQVYIVCPDGLKDSWYFDSPTQANSQFESFFIKEYLPYIKANFPIDTQAVFITGLSMGGYGAMYLFLRHPDLFASAGSTSGVLDLNASSLKYSSLSDKLGEYPAFKKRFDAFSPINLLQNIKFSDKPIIFDCGNRDHLYQANKAFKAACDSLYINAFYFSFPGRHNRLYWRKSIYWHFVFFNRIYLNMMRN